jgi:hypothetical protein
MNTNRREWLLKNYAASAAHGQGRVGRRVAPESTAQRFLIATTASRVFQQPVLICVNPRYPREKY